MTGWIIWQCLWNMVTMGGHGRGFFSNLRFPCKWTGVGALSEVCNYEQPGCPIAGGSICSPLYLVRYVLWAVSVIKYRDGLGKYGIIEFTEYQKGC